MDLCVCVVVVQRLTDHQSSSAGDGDVEFLGYLYFSAATPLGAHGNPPSRVKFVEMHMKHSGMDVSLGPLSVHGPKCPAYFSRKA